MITAIIVDDERLPREGLRDLLLKDGDFDVIDECSNGKLAVEAIREKKPQVVFLDVRMPVLDGFGVVEAVGVDSMPLTIFITAYDKFALQAFEAQAIDYLLKPFKEERFQQALTRVKKYLAGSNPAVFTEKLRKLLTLNAPQYVDRLPLKSGGRIVFINMKEVRWVEAAGSHLRFFTETGSHLVRDSLNSLEERLDPRRFVRIHRSTIINIEQIKEMRSWYTGEYVVIMNGDKELTLSRGYRANLARLLHLSILSSE